MSKYDDVLLSIADYVHDDKITSSAAFDTAHYALLDSLGCGLMAVRDPVCHQLLGPIVPGTVIPHGARVPGTAFVLDPMKAAFDIGIMIRWLDYNDTWLAKEWGHPSDNVAGILAMGDFIARQGTAKNINMHTILALMIKAYEIQGILSLDNAFNQVGLDHVLLVKVATVAVVSILLGFSKKQTMDALSHVWVDNTSLRTYRHFPNTMSRKSWAAGDASMRALWLLWMVQHGQAGLLTPISAKHWGFSDVLFKGQPIVISRPFGSYVMENILFKVNYPAEFHAQTAIEAAIQLYPILKNKMAYVKKIMIFTQEAGVRIINKTGSLHNSADRDHCLQYMVAIALIFGELKAEHYSDALAKDPRIDMLRAKMEVKEDPQFSRDYLDPAKRAIPNAIQIFFEDGSQSELVSIQYPLGHQRRRKEALPLLKAKYENAVMGHHYSPKQTNNIIEMWDKREDLFKFSVSQFIKAWVF